MRAGPLHDLHVDRCGDDVQPQGCTLPDSGWCRPAADHTAGSQHLYMFCDNDAGTNGVTGANPGDPGFTVGTLWSYVSADNGYTWKRYEVDRYTATCRQVRTRRRHHVAVSYCRRRRRPVRTVGRSGHGHNPSLVTPTNSDDRYKQATRLKLYHSIDHGQTWTMQDVTPPNSGIIRYSWMGIADDGKTIGVGYFTHPTTTGTWHVFAGASPRFGYPVTYALVDSRRGRARGRLRVRGLLRGDVRPGRPAECRLHAVRGPRRRRQHNGLPEL